MDNPRRTQPKLIYDTDSAFYQEFSESIDVASVEMRLNLAIAHLTERQYYRRAVRRAAAERLEAAPAQESEVAA